MSVSPPAPPSADVVERAQRRRTRLLLMQGAFFFIWQSHFVVMATPEDGRTVTHVQRAVYIVWAVLLLAFIASNGGFGYPRAVRAILDDETTIDHRRRALEWGFWAAMTAGVALYATSLFVHVVGLYAIHAVLTAGIGVSLLRFGVLERRAQADA